MYKSIFYIFSFFKKNLIVFLIGCIVCFFMISLITFFPFDDSYFQYTGNNFYRNFCGKFGAVFSDFLFFIFGLPAYIVPCVMLLIILEYSFKKTFFSLSNLMCRIFGGIILLFSLCGLIEFYVSDFYYCYSGGLIGISLRTKILYEFDDVVMNSFFVVCVILGVILLMERMCLLIFNKAKHLVFHIFVYCYVCYLSKIIKIGRKFSEIFLKIKILYIVINQLYVYLKKQYLVLKRNFKKKFNYIILQIIFCAEYFIFYVHVISFFCCFLNKYFVSNKKKLIFKFYDNNYKVSCLKNFLLCRYSCDRIFFNNMQKNVKKQSNKIRNLGCVQQVSSFYMKNFRNRKLIKKKNFVDSRLVNNVFFPKKQTVFLPKKSSNVLPSIDLLFFDSDCKKFIDRNYLKEQSVLLESKLADYHVKGQVVNILQGPVITRFEVDLAPGIKSSRISSLSRDLARSLSISYLQVVEIIPGKSYIGLEIPNQNREVVYLREILDTEKFQSSHNFLTFALGKDVSGEPVIANLSDMPHLLIAGATGSGKSVGINSIIVSILYKATPSDVCFIMIDPKILELSIYENIPHLLRPVVTDIKDVLDVLHWCIDEMERRYKIMASYSVRNLKSYNDRIRLYKKNTFSGDSALCTGITSNVLEKLPYIVIIIDEFADLVMSNCGKQVELLIIRLSQKARACGMHLILATQRPSVNVITGLIKANIPSRIAFAVSSKIDSRTILDQSGAEALLGKGDMFFLPSCSSIPIRVHGAFVSDEEVLLIVKYLKNLVY